MINRESGRNDTVNKINIKTILKAAKIAPHFLATLTFFPLGVQAAPAPEPPVSANPGVQLDRVRESMEQERIAQQIREDEARRGEKVQGQAGEKQQAVESDLTFVLRKVETDKSAVLSQDELDAAIKSYIDKAVTIKDLYKIVDNINSIYVQKEYMTKKKENII